MVYKLRAAKLTLVSSVRTVFLNFPASFMFSSLISLIVWCLINGTVPQSWSEFQWKATKSTIVQKSSATPPFFVFLKSFFFYVGCFFTLCAEMEEIWQMEDKTRPSLENVAVTKPFVRMSSQPQRKTKVWQIPPKRNWKSVGADLI